jgi:hypothetical protein
MLTGSINKMTAGAIAAVIAGWLIIFGVFVSAD